MAMIIVKVTARELGVIQQKSYQFGSVSTYLRMALGLKIPKNPYRKNKYLTPNVDQGKLLNLALRCSAEEKGLVMAKSYDLGVTVSAYIRHLVGLPILKHGQGAPRKDGSKWLKNNPLPVSSCPISIPIEIPQDNR